jgi:hypothetical protein
MNPRKLLGTSILLLLVATIGVSPTGFVRACGTASPLNKPVEIADETAIIIWDAKSKTQHFIRRASFRTEASDFGFLVPTPTQPTLAEASDEAFSTLAKITEPRIVTKPRPPSGGGCGCGAAPPAGNAPQVRVLEEKRVAGYDAVVLEAESADALSKWLKDHNYDFSQALTEWVKPYVAARWKITAFKIAKDAPTEQNVQSSAVRMTFQTEQPFFPYREPTEDGAAGQKQQDGRLLRVFFIGEGRVKGVLGEKAVLPWQGKTAWAGQLTAWKREELLKLLKLPAQTPPESWWLTEFEDHSSPRSGTTDVFFSPSEDQGPVEREPHIRYVSGSVPDCFMCYALAAYMFVPCLVRHFRRQRGRAAHPA